MVSIKLILILGISILVIFAGVILFLFLKNPGEQIVSELELKNGTAFNVTKNGFIKFNLDEAEHNLSVNAIADTYINITLQSTIIKTRIDIGQIRRFDLDDDDKEDLIIELKSIDNGKANVYLKKVCFENWSCTNWSNCIEQSKTRICMDLNDCETEENKPDETEECTLSCFAQGGIFCDETEICDGEITETAGGNCCLGECIKIEAVDCGESIDCFYYYAPVCNASTITYFSEPINLTWEQTDVYYFESMGLKEDKCEVYTKLLESSGSFTSDGRDILEEEGKNETEINEIEEQINNALASKKGYEGTCNYTLTTFVSIVNVMKEEGYFYISKTQANNNDCVGNLF